MKGRRLIMFPDCTGHSPLITRNIEVLPLLLFPVISKFEPKFMVKDKFNNKGTVSFGGHIETSCRWNKTVPESSKKKKQKYYDISNCK